jgi:hypothetical protein
VGSRLLVSLSAALLTLSVAAGASATATDTYTGNNFVELDDGSPSETHATSVSAADTMTLPNAVAPNLVGAEIPGSVDRDSSSTSGALALIPEPTTALLLAMGILGLAALGRRKQK